MAESTALQAARIIAAHRAKQVEQAAVKMVRLTRGKSPGRLFSDRLNWTDRIDDLHLPKAARRVVETNARFVDRSPKAQQQRHWTFVDAMCSGGRCSLSRAWKIAKFGKHQPALDQVLQVKGIRDRFRWHAEQGHPLPAKYKDRILQSLGIDPVELQADLEMLGLAEPTPEPRDPRAQAEAAGMVVKNPVFGRRWDQFYIKTVRLTLFDMDPTDAVMRFGST